MTICPEHGARMAGTEPMHFQKDCEGCRVEFQQRSTALTQQANTHTDLLERASRIGIDVRTVVSQHRIEALVEMFLPRNSRSRMEFEEVTNDAVLGDIEDQVAQYDKAKRMRDLAGAPTHPAGQRLHVVKGGLSR